MLSDPSVRFVSLKMVAIEIASCTSLCIQFLHFSGENEDMNNRLQAVRQRVVELERNISNLHMTCEKYQQVC